MNEEITYRIRDWDKHFENHDSRKVRALSWVPVKNKHDGAGYRRVAALPNSVQVFCGWSLIIQVASRMPTRGVLRDDDGALDPADLSSKTGFPETVFKAAFDALIHPKIKWLELVEAGESPGNDADSGRCRDAPGENGVEQKGREGKGKNTACAPEAPPGWPDVDAVLSYAKDSGTGILRTDICLSWMENRQTYGYRRPGPNGNTYEIADWRSDLRGYHRTYLDNEQRSGGGKAGQIKDKTGTVWTTT